MKMVRIRGWLVCVAVFGSGASCSSFSATIVKGNDDAGVVATSTIGGAPAMGGTSSIGGSSNAGAIANSGGSTSTATLSTSEVTSTGGVLGAGGTSTSGGVESAGGNASVAGASSLGGAAATGGTSATGGSSTTGGISGIGGITGLGGVGGCTKISDCVNPDPVNCDFACVTSGSTGICKATVLTGPTQCATSACDDKPISGFWDAQGTPYIAYAWTEIDGNASIHLQQVKSDGTLGENSSSYALPAQQQEATLLNANSQGAAVGLIWKASISGTSNPDSVVDFAVTDVNGNATTPSQVHKITYGGPPYERWLSLQVTPAGAWLVLAESMPFGPSFLEAASGSTITTLPILSTPLYSGGFAAGIVGNTLMVTGGSCAGDSGCTAAFVLQRFSAGNLSSIDSFVTLSDNIQIGDWPAAGSLNGKLAVLWTETASPGLMFRALVGEDGSFALNPNSIASGISPRGILQSSDGGALLLGTIAGGTPITYQLIAQRLDAQLGLIGNPFPIASSESVDVSGFETHPAADGNQVLVTFNQNGAKYRLLHTNLCD